MGETVEALAHKADVPTRVKESLAEKRDRLKTQMSSAGDRVSDTAPDGEAMRESVREAVGIAQENPLGLAIGGLAVGFLAGLALPATRVESERIGPIADDVKDRVKETGHEALDRGKEVAQQAASAAAETAKEAGQEQASDLRDSVQERARQEAGEDDQEIQTGGAPSSAAPTPAGSSETS
jgi:ElaB/YqjD/DUF883 family membrane-anchored ribosome-binding protein